MHSLFHSARIYRAEIDRLRKRSSGRHHTLRVISFFPAWYRSLRSNSSALEDKIPWITFAAIRFLDRVLTKEMIVYEFGSGGSSLFFARKTRRVYSVEHDAAWFENVRLAVENEGYTNWSGQLIEPTLDDEFSSKDPSDPDACVSGSPDYRGYSFRRYVESVNSFPDKYFDLVLIDGRARPSCFKLTYSKIRPGGYIVWDNTERSYYLERIGKLAEKCYRGDFAGPGPYVDFFTQTSVWQMPRHA
jgi:hypothetical protein